MSLKKKEDGATYFSVLCPLLLSYLPNCTLWRHRSITAEILSNMIIFLWYCPFKIWMHGGRGKQNLIEGKAYLLEAGPSKNDMHWQKTHWWMRNAMVYKIQHKEERIFHGYVTYWDIEEREKHHQAFNKAKVILLTLRIEPSKSTV